MRWGGDGRGYKRNHFHNAICKYGWGTISHYTLHLDAEKLIWLPYEEGAPKEITNIFAEDDAKKLESLYISEHKTTLPEFGYNRTSGGEAEKHAPETREQMSKIHKAMWSDDAYRAKRSGRLSPYWKDYDKAIFRLLDEKPHATLKELAECANCCAHTAFKRRQEWLSLNPDAVVFVDRSGNKNPGYRGFDKKVYEFLGIHPTATLSQIAKEVGCSKETAGKYKKQWQKDYPDASSKRNRTGRHNPALKETGKRIYSYLDQHPYATLKEIMEAVSCGEVSAVKYRKIWRAQHAN